MTAQPLWLYLALDVVLGPKVDRPIDQWARDVPARRAGAAGCAVDRRSVAAARSEQVAVPARPAPPPLDGAARAFGTLASSSAASASGSLFLASGGWRRGGRAGRASPFGIVVALWGLVDRLHRLLPGLRLDVHRPRRRAPQPEHPAVRAVGASRSSVLGVGVALGRPGATRKAFALSAAALGAVLLACLLKVGIVAHQENGALIAFFLPAWMGITAALLAAPATLQHPERPDLEVAGLGDADQLGVVAAGAGAGRARAPARPASAIASAQISSQCARVTRPEHEQATSRPAGARQPRAAQHQLLVGAGGGRQPLRSPPRFASAGGSSTTTSKRSPRPSKVAQQVEGVAALDAHVGQLVAARVGGARARRPPGSRRSPAPRRRRRASASAKPPWCVKASSARAPARRQRRDRGVVVGLVEEAAGLAVAQQVGLQPVRPQAVDDARVAVARDDAREPRQLLEVARRPVVAADDDARAEPLAHGGRDRRRAPRSSPPRSSG